MSYDRHSMVSMRNAERACHLARSSNLKCHSSEPCTMSKVKSRGDSRGGMATYANELELSS